MPTISWDRLNEIEFEIADLLEEIAIKDERIKNLEDQLEQVESLMRYYKSCGRFMEPDNTSVQP